MYHNKTVTLVFPAFNEEENIAKAVTTFLSSKIVDELIVVDNNSTDQTAKIARECGAVVVKEKKQGYGFALRKGLATATSSYVVLAEPDGTFRVTDLPRLLKHILKFHAVYGSRTHMQYIHTGANMGFLLRYGNIILAKFIQLLHQTPAISDCGCTLRIFRKEVVKKILPLCHVGSSHFLPELVILTQQHGYSSTEVPVHYYKRVGTSKITGSFQRTCRVAWNMFYLAVYYFLYPSTEK